MRPRPSFGKIFEITKDRTIEHKIEELEDATDLELMGTAGGFSIEHCIYMARKYYKGDFWKDVAGYKWSDQKGECAIYLDFYKKREQKDNGG